MHISLKNNIETIINTIETVGGEAYIVGGCVRDILLSRIPEDFDITTSLPPNQILSLFPKTIATGIKHGTITVIIDNENIEVTTFRTDGTYLDSRRPNKVNFVNNINEDLARRDFTINDMAYNYKTGLIDNFGGINDLNNKLLRCVGNPETRFNEDALRILRLFRFSAQLGFDIEHNTLSSALKNAHLLKNISRERIASELFKAINSENPTNLNPLLEIGALEFCGIKKGKLDNAISSIPNDRNLRFYYLLRNLNCDHSLVCQQLKTDKKIFLICQEINKIINIPPKNKLECKFLLKNFTYDAVKYTIILNNCDEEILLSTITSGEPYLLKHLNIKGEDLIKLGIKGKDIGKTLDNLLQYVINEPEKNKKEHLIKRLCNK